MKRATIVGLTRANARLAKRLDLALSARNEAVSRIADLTEKSEAAEIGLRVARDERDGLQGRLNHALAEVKKLEDEIRLHRIASNRKTNELSAAEEERRRLVMMGNALADAYANALQSVQSP